MEPMNVDEVMNQLTPLEKVSLLSGGDIWSTQGLERLNIPSLNVSNPFRPFLVNLKMTGKPDE